MHFFIFNTEAFYPALDYFNKVQCEVSAAYHSVLDSFPNVQCVFINANNLKQSF